MNVGNNGPEAGSIKFLKGPLAGSTYPISKPVTTIGRDASNDIVVQGDQKVSRSHARVIWNNGTWTIEKLAPQNTITINRQSVQQAVIYDNTTVGLGEETTFLFQVRISTPIQASAPLAPTPVPSPRQQPFVPASPPQQPFPYPSTQAAPAFEAAQKQQQPFTPTGGRHYSSANISVPYGGVRLDETAIAPSDATGMPSIEVSSNTASLRQSYPLSKTVTNIGRDASNDIVIPDRIVSSHHLQIVRRGNQFELIHPNPERPKTLNGLLYQGRKILGDETFRKILVRGDIFRIGDENGTLVTLIFNDGTGTQPEMLAPVHPIKLDMQELTIGRAPDNGLVLAHPQVSAHHAKLVRDGNTYRILDLNSTNHVYVNAEQTTNRILKLGDEIRIGAYGSSTKSIS